MNNLLVISSWYPQLWTSRYHCPFVKEFTDLVSDRFDNIFVIVPQPYFPKIFMKVGLFKKYANTTNFYDYNYWNIKVYYPTYFTIPLILTKFIWKFSLKKILDTIKKNWIDYNIIHCHWWGWIIIFMMWKIC